MGVQAAILLPLLRGGLFLTCRITLLPWLFGEAKHASLDAQPESGDEAEHRLLGTGSGSSSYAMSNLPRPVTSTSAKSNGSATAAFGKAIRSSTNSAAPPLLSFSPSSFSALLLSLSFEESTILFALVLMEAMGLPSEILRSNWKWSLYGVVGLAVCFIPMGLSVLLTYPLLPQTNASALPRRIVLSLIPFALWLILFLKVPLPGAIATTNSLLESALARTAVVGVTLIALLSGSGAMGAALDSYELLFASNSGRKREVTASDVRSAEASFNKACEDLQRTKADIERKQSEPEAVPEGGMFAGIGRAFRGSTKDRELKALNVELSSLNMLASSMRDELDEIRTRRSQAEWRRTFGGRIWIAIGHAFAAYCVMRLVISLLSLLLFRYSSSSGSSSPDLISTLFAQLLRFIDADLDVATWSKQISLLFVGVLILGRLRVVLNYLAQFFRAAAAGISTSFLILFLAELLSVYLLATLIQLRTSLPPAFAVGGSASPITPPPPLEPEPAPPIGSAADHASLRRALNHLISLIPRQGVLPGDATTTMEPPLLATLPDFNIVFGALFDATFLLSAAVTLVWRFLFAAGRGESILFAGRD